MTLSGDPPFLGDVIDDMRRSAEPMPEIRLRYGVDAAGQIPENVELLIGTAPPPEAWEAVELLRDRTVAVAADRLLKQRYGDRLPALLASVEERGDIRLLYDLPFALLIRGGATWACPDGMRVVMRSNSNEMLNGMCLRGECAILSLEDYARRQFGPGSGCRILPLRLEGGDATLSVLYRRDRPLILFLERKSIKKNFVFASKRQRFQGFAPGNETELLYFFLKEKV